VKCGPDESQQARLDCGIAGVRRRTGAAHTAVVSRLRQYKASGLDVVPPKPAD
jgi:hypothetical protein